MYYHRLERKQIFDAIGTVVKHLMCAINPGLSKSLLTPSEEVHNEDGTIVENIRENVHFDDDTIRSDSAGHYVGNDERMKLYRNHIEKMNKGDPEVRTLCIGNPPKK